jgi:hypothetical protein
MQLENQTDHVAILALMLVGVLIRRLEEVGQIDEPTARQIHKLAGSVRTHAGHAGLTDLRILFENIDRALGASLHAEEGKKVNAGTIPLAL